MSARSLNKVMLIGNLTRDPNLRFTPKGTAVCNFGLATNRTWASSDGGEKVDQAEFHNIVAWGKLGEICGQLLHKGDKVYVDGRIQTRDWKSDDGQDRRTTEIIIENMMLLSSRSGGSSYSDDYDDSSSNSNSSSSYQDDDDTADDQTTTESEDIADDIPF